MWRNKAGKQLTRAHEFSQGLSRWSRQVLLPFTLLALTVVLPNYTSAEELEEQAGQRLSPVKRALKWIEPASRSQEEPWFLCLRLRGTHLVYTHKIYGIQARYRSWTAEWRRHRPKGYSVDEGVGLVTDQEVASLYVKLNESAESAELPHQDTHIAPPCDPDVEERSAVKRHHELIADIWLRRPASAESRLEWRHWRLANPHLALDETPRAMINLIEDQIRAVAEQRVDLDLLLSPGQSGSLYLQVSQASGVWINGVYRGQWPSVNPVKLSEGKYHLRVVPLDERFASVQFEDLEVLADKKTKFKVELEFNDQEE